MQTIFGKSVFGGIAIGKISVYKKGEQQVKRVKVEDTQEEIERFHRAKEEAIKQLQGLYEKAVKEVGESSAAIFEIHQMMMEDEDYLDSIENIISSQQLNAEYAVATTSDNFASMFSSMDDDYMKERAADVRDVSERILSILNGESKDTVQTQEAAIIVADDLAPSETVQLDKEKVLSFVTVHGSTNSHTAILARTMGIPALIGTPVAYSFQWNFLTNQRTTDLLLFKQGIRIISFRFNQCHTIHRQSIGRAALAWFWAGAGHRHTPDGVL